MARKKSGEKNLQVGSIREISGEVNIAAGDIYKGYTAEQVSDMLARISSTFQPKAFDGACPYKGLEVFEEADAELFFGRERWVKDLVRRVKESRTVFITGPSGSGKSSLVRAGIIPALKKESNSAGWLYGTLKPGRDPIEAMGNMFSRLKDPGLGKYLRENADQVSVLHECAESALSERTDQRLVLFVDQFEEVFTQLSNDKAQTFINLLNHAATVENGRVIILFSMRSDFVPNCATSPQLNALLNQQFVQIGAMEPEELVSAIAQPALRVGLKIDPDLIAQIINDMKGEPGALPLMQFALKDLFDAEQAKGRMIALTLSDYLEHGGINQALERHANASLAQLTDDEKDLARSVFSGLIEIGRGTQDTRRTALSNELIPPGAQADAVKTVVQKLATARLITTDAATVMIAHEKLIDAWPWLKKLVNENRDVIALQNEIAADAKEWEEQKRDPSYLYSGARLATAREKMKDQKIALSMLAKDFIEQSVVLQDAERKRRESLRKRITISLVTGIMIAATLAVFGFAQAQLATDNADKAKTNLDIAETAQTFAGNNSATAIASAEEAKRQAEIARANELVAQAQQLHQNNLQLSLLLGIEAYRKHVTYQSQQLLLSNTQNPRELIGFYGQQGNIFSGAPIAISPDDKLISTGGSGKWIILWDLESRKSIFQIPTVYDSAYSFVSSMAFSADGKVFAAAEGNSILLWNIAKDSQIAIFYSGSPLIDHISFSQDGKTLAVSGNNSTIEFWDVQTGEIIDILSSGMDIFGAHIAFSPDSKWFISVSTECDYSKNPTECNPRIYYFDAQSLELKIQVYGTVGRVSDISISADSKSLAVSGEKGIEIWDISEVPFTSRTISQSNVHSLNFSPDGKALAIGGEKISILNLDGFEETDQSFIAHSGPITSIRYTADGKKLVSGGCTFNATTSYPACDKGETILWNLASTNPIAISISTVFPPDSDIIERNLAKNYLVLDNEGENILWDASQNQQVGFLIECPQDQSKIIFIPEGTFIAQECALNKSVHIWRTSPFQEIITLPIGGMKSFAISRDEKLLAIRTSDNIILQDISKQEFIGDYIPIEDGQGKDPIAFSPDGQYIAAGSCNATENPQAYCEPKVLIWDVKTENLVHEITLAGQISTIRVLTYSPDGKILASGNGGNGIFGGDASIILWDSETGQQMGQPLKPLDSFIGDVWSLSFSPDGLMLVSNDESGGITLWDMSNFQMIVQFRSDFIITDYVSFTGDGNLLTSNLDGTLLFELSSQKWIEIACERAGRNFTNAEWALYFPDEEYRKTCEQWYLEPTVTP